jgi:hypothetical protein
MHPRSPNRGWAIGVGVLLGAGAALAFYPLARSTMAAQAAVALGQSPEWLRAAYEGRAPQLERRLAAAADKAELQVAGATLLRAEPVRFWSVPGGDSASGEAPEPDRSAAVLARLDALARRFPTDPSIRAHQLRYLALSAVWLRRLGPSRAAGQPLPSATGPASRRPSPEAVARFEAAAAEGQRLEPGNAFFELMRAAAAFIEEQDDRALGDLHAAAAKPYWNDYTAEEVQVQWRLLQAAYGNRGALQKLPSSANLPFSHFRLLRQVAQRARWHIAQHEHAGDRAGAQRVRSDLMRLGTQLADGSPLPVGKWVGADIFDLGCEPAPELRSSLRQVPQTVAEQDRARKAIRERYAASLERAGQPDQATWVRSEGDRLDRERVRARLLLQDDAWFRSLLWLAAWWLFGPLFLRQILVLLVLWGAAIGIGRARRSQAADPRPVATSTWVAIYLTVLLGPAAGLMWLAVWWVVGPLFLWLMLALLALWGVAFGIGRAGRSRAAVQRPAASVWPWISLAIFLAPTLGLIPWPWISLAIFLAPTLGLIALWGAGDQLFVGTLVLGMALTGLLALAHRMAWRAHANQDGGSRRGTRPRWQPALVAALCVLPSAALFLILWQVFRSAPGSALPGSADEMAAALRSACDLILKIVLAPDIVRFLAMEDGPVGIAVLLPAVVPAALLAFLVLCRVAALGLPLRSGLAHGVRRAAPYAVALLAGLYLVSLVPTMAADRVAEARVKQLVSASVDTTESVSGP